MNPNLNITVFLKVKSTVPTAVVNTSILYATKVTYLIDYNDLLHNDMNPFPSRCPVAFQQL